MLPKKPTSSKDYLSNLREARQKQHDKLEEQKKANKHHSDVIRGKGNKRSQTVVLENEQNAASVAMNSFIRGPITTQEETDA